MAVTVLPFLSALLTAPPRARELDLREGPST
jgi:hypothetical protein